MELPIVIVNKIISYTNDIEKYYCHSCHKKISCMLSGTRAEGWGLPFIESAYCGLPIIATNYSSFVGHQTSDL